MTYLDFNDSLKLYKKKTTKRNIIWISIIDGLILEIYEEISY